MITVTAFEAALRGDGSQLVREAGPGAVVLVAEELASALAAPAGADHVVLGRRLDQGVEVRAVGLPGAFRVRDIAVDGEWFVLTGVDGRFFKMTPEQLAASPEVSDILLQGPWADPGLANAEQIAEASEALVVMGDKKVWVSFDDEPADRVLALLPHARAVLASLERLGRAGAEYLWSLKEEPGDAAEEAEFFADMVPTSLVVQPGGEYVIHYEGTSGKYCLDGYWLAVQFTPEGTPADFFVEA